PSEPTISKRVSARGVSRAVAALRSTAGRTVLPKPGRVRPGSGGGAGRSRSSARKVWLVDNVAPRGSYSRAMESSRPSRTPGKPVWEAVLAFTTLALITGILHFGLW